MYTLPKHLKVRIVSSICEGSSLRATARLHGVHNDTVQRLARLVGEGCLRLHDEVVRGLHLNVVQIDEMHSYIHTRQHHLKPTDPPEWGEAWVYVALDTSSRLVVSHRVGKRDAANARAFVADVRTRVVGKPVIASDGLQLYIDAVSEAFGADARYGQMVKQYEQLERADGTARDGRYTGATRTAVYGAVREQDISTSYVERWNGTLRMMLSRRFVRRGNGASKKLDRMRGAVALAVMFYNFVRPHETLRVTPAMEAGLASEFWSIEQLLDAALAAAPANDNDNDGNDAPPPIPPTPPVVLRERGHLRLVKGGAL